MVRHGALHRLTDPPRRIRRELEATPPVELLDRAVQPERSLLNQIEERDAESAVPLRDRDDQSQVRLDHVALRGQVAALDALCELHLLRGVQELVPAHVGEEELERVGGSRERLARPDGCLCGLLRLLLLRLLRQTDLEAHRLQLPRHLLDLLGGELLLGDERLELGRIDPTTLLGALDDALELIRFEEFDELVLGQPISQSFHSFGGAQTSLTLSAFFESSTESRA